MPYTSVIFRAEARMEDLDSTQVLLDSTVATPDFVDSVMQDEEEEEIFFGTVTAKERKIMPKR